MNSQEKADSFSSAFSFYELHRGVGKTSEVYYFINVIGVLEHPTISKNDKSFKFNVMIKKKKNCLVFDFI